MFTDITLKVERVTLVEKNRVASNESEVTEIFRFFGNIVQNLGIDGLFNISSDNDFVTIRKTIENIKISKSSWYKKVKRENMDQQKSLLTWLTLTSKATQQGDIPTKIIKENKVIFSYFISASFNSALNQGVFPD